MKSDEGRMEYRVHGDILWKVLHKPWWIYGNEMIAIESENRTYSSFATKWLVKVEK